MSDASQFTLSLFDSSALSWTIPAPDASFGSYVSDEEDEDPDPSPPAAPATAPNFFLEGDRGLARGWPARAADNLHAIRLSKELEASGRMPTPDEQAALLRFVGFGASELAQNCFPLPGVKDFRPGWKNTGRGIAEAVTPAEYAALHRATQYAHYTPEPIIRALWAAAQHLGFTGGRVLEPGMGIGLFFALLPEALRSSTRLTGVEYDPVTARIARFVHPQAWIRCEDYTRSRLSGNFDLVIGNPPFANRIVRGDPTTAALGLRLHDYFIASSIARLRPGGLALFVTSIGTMDKGSTTAREHIHSMADLVGAVRLPEGSMRATAGTDVVVDVLVFQRRLPGRPPGGLPWLHLKEITLYGSAIESDAKDDSDDTDGRWHDGDAFDPLPDALSHNKGERAGIVEVNEWFAAHPEMVLGNHAQRRGMYGPGLRYTCRPRPDAAPLETALAEALARLPAGIFEASAESTLEPEHDVAFIRPGTAADGATIKEGSYLIGRGGVLMQVEGGVPTTVKIKAGASGEGITGKAVKIIRALLPIRDAVREVLRAQAADLPWTQAQVKLRIAYSTFIRHFGPINHTVVSVAADAETGEERETHRRPNLSGFADDPDCWLVASIEDYDLDSGLARMGPVFRERVIAPPAAPLITNAADALAVTLSATGRVDLPHLCDLLERNKATAVAELGTAVFHNPLTGIWETADAYLSGAVRTKLATAIEAAKGDPQYGRNVAALREVQPEDLRPSDITARLGAPWIPTGDIKAFAAEVMETQTIIRHCTGLATWNVDGSGFLGTAAGTSIWGTGRRHAGLLLHDALNSATPQIYDTVVEGGTRRQVLNVEATEAAKDKLLRIKKAFTAWIWTDPDRTDRLARLYNDQFNSLIPRHFDGSHLTLPGAATTISFRAHQKRGVWRIITAGTTYLAHCVGSGKTFLMAAAIMEQKRLGLITKPILVVPSHCLAQASREFLQLYPTARILVADETNFTKDKRSRFLARAATANWDCIIITHSAFRFIAVPAAFEREMIEAELATYETMKLRADQDDRTTRKCIEAMKEKLGERLEAIKVRRDDMLTLEEIGVDQIIVDEAQAFRKLSFATNRTTLKGVDPDGSQMAWDLYVKSRFIETKNPGRALIQASGTPITNTLGEMFTLLRYHDEAALFERGVHEFDAWASAFGDTSIELELQPSGTYKPVERFSEFINVPELIDMFRTVADVVQKSDLRQYLTLPTLRGGQRQLVTAPASDAFRSYQKHLALRIDRIEKRRGKPKPGDDILLSVITDGRHAAMDMRLVEPSNENEPGNKINLLIANAFAIWQETATWRYKREDGTDYPHPGASQLIFSDLGTLAAAATRGFSVYAWIKQELVRLGVPASQIAIVQNYKKSTDKQRLFNDFKAGTVRFILGSTQMMGTGTNGQLRLIAEHHADVPWLPSDIEQREGRIDRQGNQNEEIRIFAYATLGSMDATMWQNNERKARFIAAALSGDRSIRRLEDVGSQANQFAMAKAIASGDSRLMRKAGLQSEIARLERQQAAHLDDQLDIRRRVASARNDQAQATRRIAEVEQDLLTRKPIRGEAFTMEVNGRTTTERKTAGNSLLSKLRLAELERVERDWTIGEIAGFELQCDITKRLGWRATLTLERSGLSQEIRVDPDLTPLGLIARLEHLIGRFEDELHEERRNQADAGARLRGYAPRLGEAFALQGELEGKLAEMADLQADLARTASVLDNRERGNADTSLAA